MPKIVIIRKSEWMNRLKRFSVLINGKEVGTVKTGGTEEFNTEAGQQTIECKVNWYYSNKFIVDAKEGEAVYLQVKSNTIILMLAFLAIVCVFLATMILQSKGYIGEPVMKIVRLSYFVFLLAYFIYTLTIGRKRYLLLEPDTSNPFAN
jgi:hypothetical protein